MIFANSGKHRNISLYSRIDGGNVFQIICKRNFIFTIKKYRYMAEAKSQMSCRYRLDFSTRVAIFNSSECCHFTANFNEVLLETRKLKCS